MAKEHQREEVHTAVSVDFKLKNGTTVKMRITPTETGYHLSSCWFPWPFKRSIQVSCECHGAGQVSRAEGTCSEDAVNAGNYCRCVNGKAVIVCDGKTIDGSDPKPEFQDPNISPNDL